MTWRNFAHDDSLARIFINTHHFPPLRLSAKTIATTFHTFKATTSILLHQQSLNTKASLHRARPSISNISHSSPSNFFSTSRLFQSDRTKCLPHTTTTAHSSPNTLLAQAHRQTALFPRSPNRVILSLPTSRLQKLHKLISVYCG